MHLRRRAGNTSKSTAGRRTVAIPPHVIDDLAHHLATYAEPGAQRLVSVGPKGGPIRRNDFSARVGAPAAEAAGLPPALIYTTRRCGAPSSPPGTAPGPGS